MTIKVKILDPGFYATRMDGEGGKLQFLTMNEEVVFKELVTVHNHKYLLCEHIGIPVYVEPENANVIPTRKDKSVEESLSILSGDSRVKAVNECRCLKEPIGCGKAVDFNDFKDTVSLKEYAISGRCQECQDIIEKAFAGL
jgi:hypothetical protein